jgi:hypothetical protein
LVLVVPLPQHQEVYLEVILFFQPSLLLVGVVVGVVPMLEPMTGCLAGLVVVALVTQRLEVVALEQQAKVMQEALEEMAHLTMAAVAVEAHLL